MDLCTQDEPKWFQNNVFQENMYEVDISRVSLTCTIEWDVKIKDPIFGATIGHTYGVAKLSVRPSSYIELEVEVFDDDVDIDSCDAEFDAILEMNNSGSGVLNWAVNAGKKLLYDFLKLRVGVIVCAALRLSDQVVDFLRDSLGS
jgi:hypothetical protein